MELNSEYKKFSILCVYVLTPSLVPPTCLTIKILYIMELTNKKKEELRKEVAEQAAKVLPADHVKGNRQFPTFAGDTFTITVTDKTKVSDFLVQVKSDNAEVNDWAAILFADDKRLSYTQLFSRPANGLELVGKDDEERMQDFILRLYEKNTLTLKVKEVKMRPQGKNRMSSYLIFDKLS